MRGVPSDSPGLPPTRTFSVSLDLKKEKQKVPEVTRPISGEPGRSQGSRVPGRPCQIVSGHPRPCVCAYACVLGEYTAVLSCRDSHCAGASPARCLSRCPFSGNPLVPAGGRWGEPEGAEGRKPTLFSF